MKKLKLRYLILSLVTIGLLGLVGYDVWKQVFYGPSGLPPGDSSKLYNDQAEQILEGEVPVDPLERVTYYSVAASNYHSAGDYRKAAQYYIEAQKVIDENDLAKEGYSFYQPIATEYQLAGEKAKAREYYQKEIDRASTMNLGDEYIKQLEDIMADV